MSKRFWGCSSLKEVNDETTSPLPSFSCVTREADQPRPKQQESGGFRHGCGRLNVSQVHGRICVRVEITKQRANLSLKTPERLWDRKQASL